MHDTGNDMEKFPKNPTLLSHSEKKSKSKSNMSKSDNKSGKNYSLKQKTNSGSTQGTTATPKETTSDISSKLGKDGKLMPQGHQCQLNNNLFLFCGNSGHVPRTVPRHQQPKPTQPKLSKTSLCQLPAQNPRRIKPSKTLHDPSIALISLM